jgi:hypothetical protein
LVILNKSFKEPDKLSRYKMINSVRALLIVCISSLLVLCSCKKNDDEPAITTKYRLTLKATPPSNGNTVFSTISYKNADGTTVTLNGTTTSFLESFDITAGYTIFFNVAGTNDATNQPAITINYTLEKYENNVYKGLVCFGSSVTVGGSAGSWVFNASNNSTFNGVSCQ